MASPFECGNEPSGFIECGEFLDWVRNRLASEGGLSCIEFVS